MSTNYSGFGPKTPTWSTNKTLLKLRGGKAKPPGPDDERVTRAEAMGALNLATQRQLHQYEKDGVLAKLIEGPPGEQVVYYRRSDLEHIVRFKQALARAKEKKRRGEPFVMQWGEETKAPPAEEDPLGPLVIPETFTEALTVTFGLPATLMSPAQRALCRVAYDGLEPEALTDPEEREAARAIFGDVDTIPPLCRRIITIVAGRGSGKSSFSALRVLHLCLTVPLKTAAGEFAYGLFVAPDLRTARQAFRFALGAIEANPQLTRLIVALNRNNSNRSNNDGVLLKRPDGKLVRLECLPAKKGGSAVRGRTIVAALLDEVAFFEDKDHAVNDEDLYKAIAPRIIAKGQLIIGSTPYLERGLLYEFYSKNWSHPVTSICAWAPTALMRANDNDTLQMVDIERQRNPDNFAVEFNAEFLSGASGNFFDEQTVLDAVDADRTPALPPLTQGAGTTAAGGDFGFRSDSSALAIVQYALDGKVHLARIDERRPRRGQPLKPSEVVGEFAEALRFYGIGSLTADSHYVEAVREHLHAKGLALSPEPDKNESYFYLRSLFADRRIRLPKHTRLIAQLCSIRSKPAPGGGLTIYAPRAKNLGHGDLVSALVLACWAGREGRGYFSREAVDALFTDVPGEPPVRGWPDLLRTA